MRFSESPTAPDFCGSVPWDYLHAGPHEMYGIAERRRSAYIMKHLVTIAVMLLLVVAAKADTPFGLDSILLPPGYTFKHGMGTDSYYGTLQKQDGLKITCDIGIGAGFWARPEDKEKYVWFREIQINGNTAFLAMRGTPEKKVIGITFKKNWANFITEIGSEADVAEFIAILSSYKPTNE